ncbi:MAG: HAD-IB family phosphatase [Chloroflexi bacterium]|nr:HAD-IB family phosphatase [Chloroflexota bacterium]
MNFHPPAKSFRIVCFDCDSTLTAIEGIDELARLKGQFEHIANLTRRAMDGELKFEDVFAERLRLLQPTRADLKHIARAYQDHLLPDARPVIAALRAAGCPVHIVSGGLLPAVETFARALGLSAQNVHAVPVVFDQLAGHWWQYDQHRYAGNPDERYLAFAPTPLSETNGKRSVIAKIANGIAETMLVGDGVTDLEARDAVKLFVGFGGVVRRERVATQAEVFVQAPRLAAIVPLALSHVTAQQLIGTEHETILQQGLDDIAQSQVLFRKV